MKKLIFLLTIFFLVLTPIVATAYTMQVKYPAIPNVRPTTGLVDYIRYIYLFALGAVGLVAFGVMVYGGIIYMMSGTNIVDKGEAKKWFKAAISGLLLALASYLILNTINPNLVRIKAPTLPATEIPAVTTPTSLSTLQLGESCENTSLTCDASQNLTCQGGVCIQTTPPAALPTSPLITTPPTGGSPSIGSAYQWEKVGNCSEIGKTNYEDSFCSGTKPGSEYRCCKESVYAPPSYSWEDKVLCQGIVPGNESKRYYCAANSFCSLADKPTGDYCCCSTRDR